MNYAHLYATGTRKYLPCLCTYLWRCYFSILIPFLKDVYNKIDAISIEQVVKLAHQDHTVVISCEADLKYVLSRPAVRGPP